MSNDQVWLLETNLDDVPGEVIGYCFEQLLAAGALDVFTTPIQMKKHRPGVLLSVLVDDSHVSTIEDILFRETATFGVRRTRLERHKLHRQAHQVSTPWGLIDRQTRLETGRKALYLRRNSKLVPRLPVNSILPLITIYREVQKSYETAREFMSNRYAD